MNGSILTMQVRIWIEWLHPLPHPTCHLLYICILFFSECTTSTCHRDHNSKTLRHRAIVWPVYQPDSTLQVQSIVHLASSRVSVSCLLTPPIRTKQNARMNNEAQVSKRIFVLVFRKSIRCNDCAVSFCSTGAVVMLACGLRYICKSVRFSLTEIGPPSYA